MSKKPGKSETLTIRLDPKTRFMLEFVSRLRGQTITTVVERAIEDAADQAKVENPGGPDFTWRDYWAVSEGERALRIAKEPELRPTYEEDLCVNFANIHWPFFYVSARKLTYRTSRIDILWPRIDEFIRMFQNREGGYFGAGRAMAAALSQAGVEPPEWPPKKEDDADFGRPSPMETRNNLDDDVPF